MAKSATHITDHRWSEKPEHPDQTIAASLPHPALPHPSMRPYPRLQREPDPARAQRTAAVARVLMQRLRRWRVEQCLSREALAELSGVPLSTIKRAERSGAVGFLSVIALLDALGLADDLAALLLPRRRQVPSVVLHSRSTGRQRGRRAPRPATPRDRA